MAYLIPLIVPVLNNFEGFTRLVQSLGNEMIMPIVIPNYEVHNSVASSWNKGMSIALEKGFNHAIIANDDTRLVEGSLSTLIHETAHGKIFAFPRDIGSSFAFFAVNIKMMKNLGEFDERFSPAYFEDNDAIYRAKLAKLDYSFSNDVLVEHEGSATQFKNPQNPVVSHEMFRGLQDTYVQKWGGLPGSETYTTPFNAPDFEFGLESEAVRQQIKNCFVSEAVKDATLKTLKDVLTNTAHSLIILDEYNEIDVSIPQSGGGYIDLSIGVDGINYLGYNDNGGREHIMVNNGSEWVNGERCLHGHSRQEILEKTRELVREKFPPKSLD